MTPPEVMKRRVVKTRDVREIVAGAFARMAQDYMVQIRAEWPDGAINLPPLDAQNSPVGASQIANYHRAESEAEQNGEFHPGYSEAE